MGTVDEEGMIKAHAALEKMAEAFDNYHPWACDQETKNLIRNGGIEDIEVEFTEVKPNKE